jgi:transcriptional regulator of NAD metabolism
MKGYREGRRLSITETNKVRNRFFNKIEEYKLKSLEELEKIVLTEKLSSTDRNALLVAKNQVIENLKAKPSDDGSNEEE